MKVRNLRVDEIDYYKDLLARQGDYFMTNFAEYLNANMHPRGFYLDSLDDTTFFYCDGIRTCTGEERYIGIRPVIEYDDEWLDVSKIKTKFVGSKMVEYIEFGEYPKNIVNLDTRIIFEERLKTQSVDFRKIPLTYYSTANRLVEVGKEAKSKFKFFKHDVLALNFGNKFLRCLYNRNTNFFQYIETNTNNTIWFKIEPIEWILDRENNLLIAERTLLTGIPYQTTKHSYSDSMKYFTLSNYLNNVFLNEIQGKLGSLKDDYVDDVIKKGYVDKYTKTSPLSFNLTKVSEEDIITGAILSDVPVFLHGKSGDGKSDRVAELDPNLEVLYMRNATPESLTGKSVVLEGKEELIDVPPTWYLRLVEKCQREPDKFHILFFDELTNALPSIQSMAFNNILDKEVNGKWKLPENVRIVAAGNEIEDSLSSYGLAEPLYGRFAHVHIKTTKDNWIKWAIESQIHPMIIAYICSMGDNVLRTKYTGVESNATPRKWEMASKILYKTRNPELLREIIGDALTTEFIHFCFSPVITLEDVINNNYVEDLVFKMDTSVKYATLIGLSAVDIEHFDIVYEFVKLMNPESVHLFEVLWCKNDSEKLEYLLLKKQEKILTKKVGI